MKLKMTEILKSFKLNKLSIVLLFLVLLIGLLSFVYFRDSAIYISRVDYNSLVENRAISSARLDEGKVYLTYDGKE